MRIIKKNRYAITPAIDYSLESHYILSCYYMYIELSFQYKWTVKLSMSKQWIEGICIEATCVMSSQTLLIKSFPRKCQSLHSCFFKQNDILYYFE